MVLKDSENELESTPLDVIIPHEIVRATPLQQGMPIETIQLIITGAEDLLNSNNTISAKPTWRGLKQYLVHSKHTKASYTCTVNLKHVTCECRGYKSKKVCKHSLAIAYKTNKLIYHLEWLKKQQVKSNMTALITKNKPGMGQKGGKQKTRPRVLNSQLPRTGTVSISDNDYNASFTKCYHNNNDFVIIKKAKVRKDRYNKSFHCNLPFEHVIPGPPNNIVIWHRGAWEYPTDKQDPSSVIKVSAGSTDYYYHIRRSCIRERYPHFLPHMLKIGAGIVLNKVQRDLKSELSYTML